MKKLWMIALAACCVLALAACTALSAVGCGRAEEYTGPELILRYAENQPEDYPTTQAALAFADLVAERFAAGAGELRLSGADLHLPGPKDPDGAGYLRHVL